MAEPVHTANAPSPEAGVPTSHVSTVPVSTPTAPAPRYRYRLRFRKGGDLRLVSHHDLMHVVERMLRRAEIPIAQTQGFHPQPRMVFALSLALGIAGANEVLELDLTEPFAPETLRSRLACQAPSGLEIVSARRLGEKSSSLVRRAWYRLPLQLEWADAMPADAVAPALRDLPQRCAALLEEPHLWVQRSRPQPRRLDIRPYLSALRVRDGNLEMAVWVTPTGTARPEEFARLLGLERLLEAGAFFERTDLEMADESAAPLPEMPRSQETFTDAVQSMPVPGPSCQPAPRPTALLPGPLSFDS